LIYIGFLRQHRRNGNDNPFKAMNDERCAAILEAIHYVIKGEKILKGAGLTIDVIPVPREISSDCGMALEFSCRERDRVEQLLGGEDISVVGIYALRKGQYSKL
jgi:hypothetical protein